MGTLRRRLGESFGAMRAVFSNRDLRRVQLAWAASFIGRWAYGVALLVFAYKADGAAAVGVLTLVKTLTAALAAPFTSSLADRFPRARVMLTTDLARTTVLAAMAAAAFGATPALVVYALGVVESVLATAYRPAQAALLPQLARSPDELTAANVASSSIESVGIFLGPALGGLLLAAAGTGVVFAATAAAFLAAALAVARIDVPAERRERDDGTRRGHLGEALAGFRAIRVDPRLRLLVGLYAAQTLVGGAFNVLVVVIALDLLEIGDAGVGWLNSAVGVGGVVGAVVAVTMVGRRRLAPDFGLGLILWGAPLLLVGIWPNAITALLLFAVIGVGNTIVDVAGLTLLQRAVPNEILARVFGALESLLIAMIGVGAVLAPALIALLDTRGALLVAGALLPALTLATWRKLATIDAAVAPPAELELLRAVPILGPLPTPALEGLASTAERVRVAADQVVFRQGDVGDRFYVVASGRFDVDVDGRAAKPLGPGDYFGEIALLRDVARTGTVVAREDSELLALERDDFIGAVTGHAPSAAAAETVIGTRLGALRPARVTPV